MTNTDSDLMSTLTGDCASSFKKAIKTVCNLTAGTNTLACNSVLHSNGHGRRTLDLAVSLMSQSSTRDRHPFGKSTHGDLASAASVRNVTGRRRPGLFCRLLDKLVQFCQAAFAAVSKRLHAGAVHRVRRHQSGSTLVT